MRSHLTSKRALLSAVASSALTAVVLAASSSARPLDPAVNYYRGWAIQGSDPYFQVWNPGPAPLCVKTMTVTSSVNSSAVFLFMDKPLPTDIADFGASWPEGTDLSGSAGDERVPRSQGQLRASIGSVQLGAQMLNFTLLKHIPHTFKIDDCLGSRRGIAIRVAHEAGATPWVKIGARWTE